MLDEAAGEQHTEQFGKWKAWDEFLTSKPNTGFRQASWYTAFKVAYNGWKHLGTVLRDGETIVGGAVAFRRSFNDEQCYYYIPEGPVLLESDSDAEQERVFCAIMDFFEEKRHNEQK